MNTDVSASVRPDLESPGNAYPESTSEVNIDVPHAIQIDGVDWVCENIAVEVRLTNSPSAPHCWLEQGKRRSTEQGGILAGPPPHARVVVPSSEPHELGVLVVEPAREPERHQPRTGIGRDIPGLVG